MRKEGATWEAPGGTFGRDSTEVDSGDIGAGGSELARSGRSLGRKRNTNEVWQHEAAAGWMGDLGHRG